MDPRIHFTCPLEGDIILKKVLQWIDKNTRWIMTLPVIVFILVMIAYPLFYTFRLSFHNWSLSSVTSMKWAGLKNYKDVLTDDRFIDSCWRTFLYAVVTLAFQTVAGLGLALFINREFRLKGLTRTMFLLPLMATPVAVAMVWKLMYDYDLGAINYALDLLGLSKVAFLGEAKTALWALILVDVWQHTPIVMLMCLGGLSSIPSDCLEAAAIDGANRRQILTKITLPLLSPTILTAMMLRLIDLLKVFDHIYNMTHGGPGNSTTTINIIAYQQAFENFRFGKASATITIFFVILVIAMILFNYIRSKTVVDY